MNKQHEQLIAAYMAGEDVSEQLLDACREHPELLQRVSDLVAVDRLLAFKAYDEDESLFSAEVRQRLESHEDDAFVDDIRNQLEKASRRKLTFFVRLAAAACVAIAVTLPLMIRQTPPRPDLAQLTACTDAAWKKSAIKPGDALKEGLLSLEEGYSEITMHNGVRLVLEAPVEIELCSLELVRLNHGTLVASVPEPAIGFTVLTPNSEVIDLGTEFAVAVAASGACEVHVLEGEVKARPREHRTFTKLTKNEGVAIGENQHITMIQSQPERFRRALPGRSAKSPQYLHWSCDGEAELVECGGTGINGKFYPGQLEGYEGGEGPVYANGQFGKALYFNGEDAYVQTAFSGIGGTSPRTVAFWAKVPKNFSELNGYGMLGWGLMEFGSAWQVSPNPDSAEGLLGRLRIGTKDAPIVGTTDLRDNRWHHVAVVMYGGDDADLSTHVLLYVDGQLEKTSLKSVARIETELGHERSLPLMFGRNIGFADAPTRVKARFFKGWLDEIFVVDTALEQEKIQRLMESNSLTPRTVELADADNVAR